MTPKTSRLLSLILLITLIFTTMVWLPQISLAAPELPGGPVPVSEGAANVLDGKILAAYAEAESSADGSFTLTATDEEVTSWFVYRIATDPANNIADPQIRFTGDRIHAAITVVGLLPFELRVKLVARFEVVDNQVNFEIESSSAGILPVPKPIMDLLPQSDMVNQILQDAGVELNSVEILEGEIVLKGKLLPLPENA
jgi:hypothetical protein